MSTWRPSSLIVALILMVLMGCGARKEYGIAGVTIDRTTWDSVQVDVDFNVRTTIGRAREIAPDELNVLALSSRHDTLYAGLEPRFAVDDARLGDREGIIVEVCGRFRDRLICAQEGVRSSPKRVTVREQIDYPTDDTYDRGRYDLAVRVERATFSGDGWEEIDFSGTLTGHLEAYVEGAPDEPVRIPYTRPRGGFDLSRLDNYQDFRFYLDSQLMDHQEAQVTFLVYGGIDGASELLSTTRRTVSAVMPQDRLANVQGFVRQVARHFVGELSTFLGGRRTVAYVNGWEFDHDERRYAIEMEFVWRGSFFDNREYRLEGELHVNDNGGAPVFRLLDGNRRAIERWNDRIRRTEVDLQQLEVERPSSQYRPRGRRLSG